MPPRFPAQKISVWLVYILLFALSVPWYLPDNPPLRIWLGLPHWALVSLLATLAIALFTLLVVRRFWTESDGPGSEDEAK